MQQELESKEDSSLPKKKQHRKNNTEDEDIVNELKKRTAAALVATNHSAVEEKNNAVKKKRKVVFPFGNYRNYYGYRIGEGMAEDPRLKVMRIEWFEGKDCLDIGCNSGVITMRIAQNFRCKSILGVDIDSERINDAHWHLRKFMREINAVKSEKIACKRDLSEVVSFRRENILESFERQDRLYDTILCLSVTKWVQLNWGDKGLISLFCKIWKLLKQGGFLILEPQPWKSYQSNRTVSEVTSKNFHSITLQPDKFQDILLDKIGFRYVEEVTSSLLGSTLGFNRPIFLFQK